MSAHLIMVGAVVCIALAIYLLGWHSHGVYADRETARLRRHTHREGDPAPGVLLELPRAGRLDPLPLEPVALRQSDTGTWRFAGDWDTGPVTAELPASVTGERPIDTGELMAIDDRVTAWIAEWCAQGNYDRHTMRAG